MEGKYDEFTFDDTDGETLSAIINYCYTGCINLTDGNVKTFIAVASSVELDLLEEKCRRYCAENVCIKNAIEMFKLADKYSFTDLRQTTLDFICRKFKKIPIDEFVKLGHQLMQQVLKCDQLSSPEELIFDRLLEWS